MSSGLVKGLTTVPLLTKCSSEMFLGPAHKDFQFQPKYVHLLVDLTDMSKTHTDLLLSGTSRIRTRSKQKARLLCCRLSGYS